MADEDVGCGSSQAAVGANLIDVRFSPDSRRHTSFSGLQLRPTAAGSARAVNFQSNLKEWTPSAFGGESIQTDDADGPSLFGLTMVARRLDKREK
ncbi:hypothetical protein [Bradyrhizobium sp.]|uniref:hypothetical protein n=1 Tax=Bradyrhizobium sp. TaxID=376 RepID=UPI0007C8EC9E|nr:hypothetical protein [Bradyrhizobium sp.]